MIGISGGDSELGRLSSPDAGDAHDFSHGVFGTGDSGFEEFLVYARAAEGIQFGALVDSLDPAEDGLAFGFRRLGLGLL